MQAKNLAARAGRWSAKHRKTAIFGWLAFVIAATVLGGMVGQRTIAEEDYGNGDSRVADQAIADAGFPDDADEQVLVQGKGDVKVGDQAFTAAVGDIVNRLKAVKTVTEVESPLAKGNEGQLSEDGRSALITFKIPGDDDQVTDRVDASLAAVTAAQQANPGVRVEQFGDASADKALSEAFDDGLPEGRDPLAADHAGDPDRRLRRARRRRHPAAAGLQRRRGHARAARPAEPDRRARRGRQLGRAARRPRRRRRLLDVLPAPRDGGA